MCFEPPIHKTRQVTLAAMSTRVLTTRMRQRTCRPAETLVGKLPKRTVNPPMPDRLKAFASRKLNRLFRREAGYSGLNSRQVFEKIYRDDAWGPAHTDNREYFSGGGSHDPAIVDTYVTAVQEFIRVLGKKPDVVDLGCGDFNVGAQLVEFSSSYLACDLVAGLIDENRTLYRQANLSFRVLDMVKNELPGGDVALVRQVLQHLPNDDIIRFVSKLRGTFQHLLVTEHLPSGDDFPANVDKPIGPSIRLHSGSGVVLTRPPFNLAPKRERILCEVEQFGGVIRTHAYELE